MTRLQFSDRVAHAMPIHLTPRVFLTVDSRLRRVHGAAGSARWMLRRVVLAVSRADGAEVATIPLLPLPGRLLVELPTECIFDNWAGRVGALDRE